MMHTILGNEGTASLTLEFQGKTYKVKLIDQNVQAAWELRMYDRAMKAEQVMQDRMPKLPELPPAPLLSDPSYHDWVAKSKALSEERERRLARFDSIRDALLTGEYGILSKLGQRFLATPQGMLTLLSILTDTDEDLAMKMVMGIQSQVNRIIDLVIRLSFPGVQYEKSASVKSADEVGRMVAGQPLSPGEIAAPKQ